MTKLTSDEIIEKLTESVEPYEFEELTYQKNDNLGECEMIENKSTTSGEAWQVMYFKDHGVYIMLTGYYDSYESYAKYEDSDYSEVIPATKTVTHYIPKDSNE